MKKKKNWLCLLLTLLIFTASSAAVYADETDGDGDTEDKTLAPYFFIEGGDPKTDSLPLKETNVETFIDGVIAETYVTQTYTNEGKNPINASYVFPASTKVSVHGMKMEIGDQVITAKIKEKEEAKQEFQEAKSEGKSASLLEQQRPNVFTMDVANVMPGDTIRLELHYTELISSTDGVYQFVFPTVVGPRFASSSDEENGESSQWLASPYLKAGEAPDGNYNISVKLATGVPIADVTCKSHKINVTRNGESTAQVTLSNPEEFAGNRDFILDYKLTGQEVQCGLMLNKGEKENFFMMMVQPPERVDVEELPPREYIFVLDVSGSMNGYPLNTAKQLIQNLVSNLRETDTFNLILFSGSSRQMSDHSLPATEANIKRAINLIDFQSGGGGTRLAPALESAMAIPKKEHVSRNFVIITDGYISGEKQIFDIINSNLKTTNFFSFGIGRSVNRYLIDGIAKTGSGESFVVTNSSDAADTAERFRTYIQSPVLTDINVSYDGFNTYDVVSAVPSTLFAKRPIVVFGKYRGEPSGTIRITGKSGEDDYVQDIPVAEVTPLSDNKAISYLWARTKVELLTDYGDHDRDPEEVKKEVTKLGLDYSMMTPYTSFIAVTDTVRNDAGESTDVKQPLPLPEDVSELAVGAGYTAGSEPETMILITALMVMLSLSALRRPFRRVR